MTMPTLEEFAGSEANVEHARDLSAMKAERDTVKHENKRLVGELRLAKDSLQDLGVEFDKLANVIQRDADVPAWLDPPIKDAGAHQAMLWTTWSDFHLDEVVDYDEMNGMNEYNRVIAERRFDNIVNGTVHVPRTYMSGMNFDGIIVALGGDIITGAIHEELAETNEAPVPETIVHWAPIIASGLKRLADEYGRVIVPCVDGNHDRMYHKMRYKKRAVSSYAWIIYHSIAWLCADDDRIVFDISKAPEIIVPVYDTKFLLTHGDAFRGGGGVGGIYPAMLRWANRKLNTMDYDIAVIGHWHQLLYDRLVFVNGSLKGYDEYARGHGFLQERPQQMMFVITPENGVTMQTAIFAD